MRVASTVIQNNFGKYLNFTVAGEEIIITRNGKDIAKIVASNDADHVNEECGIYEDIDKPRVTYEEFLELTENSDLRYELIDGEVFILASPSYAHQRVITEILVHFHIWLKGKKCRALTSPFDVTLIKGEDNKNVVQPDILVICDTETIDEKGKYKGVPTLVVEVLSPSSKKHDMLRKLDLYMKTGISEFWLVDTGKKAIYMYNFENKNILDNNVFMNNDVIKSIVFEGLEIALHEVFS
ncbi:MAG TPA: type II toxin-antitoxin system prevent-host-death family antitoxin [Ruminiclostridium sp.]